MKKAVAAFVLFIFISGGFVSDQSVDTNAKIKTVFLYNFTKYIEWPTQYKKGNFVIGLLGASSSLASELDKMAQSKTVGDQKFQIKKYTSTTGLDGCHILFVAPDCSIPFSEVTSKLKGKSTLIVTERSGLAKQGSAINFVIVDNKQKFELNKGNAEKYNLKVANSLSQLAIVIN